MYTLTVATLRKLVTGSLVDLQAEITENGVRFKTGVPVTVEVTHRKQNTQNFGKLYGQDIEPTGRYVTFGHWGTPGDSTEAGNSKVTTTHDTIHFTNPLVIRWGGYGEDGWKQQLRNHYNKIGRALSKVIVQDGYDGIITVDTEVKEIVDLTSFR